MRLKRPWLWALGVVVGGLVLVGAYAGWLVWQVNKHLAAASSSATLLTTAASSGDQDVVDRALARFVDETAAARQRTDSPVWGLLTRLPQFGDDAEGVRVATRLADDLAGGAVGALAGRIGDLDELAPRGGAIDLAMVQSLQTPVAQAAREFSAASRALNDHDPSGYVSALKVKFRDLQRQVGEAAEGLNAANRAIQVMPAVLGADRPKRYLLVVQNNAETRTTGGLPGAVSVVRADRGRVSLERQVAGGGLGMADEPVLALTNGEINAYGDLTGTFFVNANLQPDWGRASDLMAARWKQVYGEKVDGAISLDPIALSYLLQVIGPMTVDGQVISSDTAVSHLLHQVYIDYPDPTDQDAHFRRVAAAIFERLTGAGAKAGDLLPALRQGAEQRRILVHSFDRSVQAVLAGTPISGEVVGLDPDSDEEPSASPQVGVFINEGSSSKMSYYLRTKLRVSATSCVKGVQTFAGRLTVTNTATKAEVKRLPWYIRGNGEDNEPGMTVPIIQIYGPMDGELAGLKVSDDPDVYHVDINDDRRPMKQVWLNLGPGETRDVTWTMTSGPDQVGHTQVALTPGVVPGGEAAVVKSAC